MTIDFSLCEKYLRMPESHLPLAQRALEYLDRDPLAMAMTRQLLDMAQRGLREEGFFVLESLGEHFKRTAPELSECLNPMLLALALPNTLKNLRAEGMSEELILDTLSDYGTWARAYEQQHGKPGFGEIGWELNFHTGCIVKLGRLQFEQHTFEAPYTIYRHRKTGKLIPVAHPETKVDANGFITGGRKIPAVFETQVISENGMIRCNRIENARILPELAEYCLDDLEPLLTTGMAVLNMHIPETGPLTPDEVNRSLKFAKEYFAAKGYPNTIAMCESWLLDPAMETYGAHSRNIIDFQRRFELIPWMYDHSDAINRVFGRGTDASDPTKLPETTGLQRGLKAYLISGAPLRDAGGVLAL